MRKRFKRLKKILQALDIEIGDESTDTLEEIQAGVFLAQLMSQNEAGDIDLTGQTGYFFKWYDGPHASDLNADYRDLINYMRFENATNGYEISEPALVRQVKRLNECVKPPKRIDRAEWMRVLAVLAYLLKAAGWEKERAFEKARRVLPIDDERLFEKAISQIDQLLEVKENNPAPEVAGMASA